jgi:hypothetical protein
MGDINPGVEDCDDNSRPGIGRLIGTNDGMPPGLGVAPGIVRDRSDVLDRQHGRHRYHVTPSRHGPGRLSVQLNSRPT